MYSVDIGTLLTPSSAQQVVGSDDNNFSPWGKVDSEPMDGCWSEGGPFDMPYKQELWQQDSIVLR